MFKQNFVDMNSVLMLGHLTSKECKQTPNLTRLQGKQHQQRQTSTTTTTTTTTTIKAAMKLLSCSARGHVTCTSRFLVIKCGKKCSAPADGLPSALKCSAPADGLPSALQLQGYGFFTETVR